MLDIQQLQMLQEKAPEELEGKGAIREVRASVERKYQDWSKK